MIDPPLSGRAKLQLSLLDLAARQKRRFPLGSNAVNERQLQLTEDLSGIFRGEVRCEPLMLAAYASDASIFQVPPLGVARPLDRDDVVGLAKYAAETGTPLIARGAAQA